MTCEEEGKYVYWAAVSWMTLQQAVERAQNWMRLCDTMKRSMIDKGLAAGKKWRNLGLAHLHQLTRCEEQMSG